MTTTAIPVPQLTDQRHLFEVDDEVAYLNTAAMSPMLKSVREAGERALAMRSRPWTIGLSHWFEPVEAVRANVAGLLATRPDNIALVPATSHGLAAVARNLHAAPGDRVLVLDQEFPSNHHTWQRFTRRTGSELRVVSREPGQTWADAVLDAIDERVAIASLPNVHWTNGAFVDLAAVVPKLRAAGARVVIDASQSLGVMPLDLATLRPDAVVAVGYKWLLGPYSLGYLYLDPSLHDGEPLEENWINREGSDDFGGLADYNERYRPGAQRFDVGERSNFQLNPMAAAALQQLLEWGVERVAVTLKTRTDAIAAGAERLGLTVQSARGPHMLGIELPRDAAERTASVLQQARVVVSVRVSSLRIAPHLHTNQADIDRLLEAVASAV